MTSYVAFLRGINVGGNKKVPMKELAEAFSSLGCTHITTYLASGNVCFDAPSMTGERIAKMLAKQFGFPIPVVLRTLDGLRKLAALDPFKNVKMTPKTRRYVTFLSTDAGNKKISSVPNFEVIRITGQEILTVLTVQDSKTVDLMQAIEKTFGKDVTTRNWNTIERILAANTAQSRKKSGRDS